MEGETKIGPKTEIETLKGSTSKKWEEAMASKMDSLGTNKVYELVDRKKGQKEGKVKVGTRGQKRLSRTSVEIQGSCRRQRVQSGGRRRVRPNFQSYSQIRKHLRDGGSWSCGGTRNAAHGIYNGIPICIPPGGGVYGTAGVPILTQGCTLGTHRLQQIYCFPSTV